MSSRFTRAALAAATLGGVGLALALPASTAPARGRANTGTYVPDHYIVVMKEGVDAPALAYSFSQVSGTNADQVYSGRIRGFSARMTAARARAIAQDPRVKYVEQDQRVSLATVKTGGRNGGGGSGSGTGTGTGTTTPPQPAQVIPTGVGRIGGLVSPTARINGLDERVNATVAVLDTGIELTHPDLNVVLNKNFVVATGTGNDLNGHGTHVAGIIGAKDNTIGVVGVAPGAKLWALKVLDDSGNGLLSNIVAGLNYVASSSATVDVANLSLGCTYSQALNDAVQACIDRGVTVVVAAGNNGVDCSGFSPASTGAAITVSAIADSDGLPGGLGTQTPYGTDDSLAWFSNYGAGIDVAGPGVNILSTGLNAGYATLSGTSQAAPHVSGAAALYIAAQRAAGALRPAPAAVRTAIVTGGELPPYGWWNNDWDGYTEPLVKVSSF